MPKVSVIVPVYNKAKYVGKCIESILAQTLSDIELIIVNDGSKDNSESVCKAYLTDKRVQYLFQDNSGPAAARQYGIDHASGEYLGFVDADDWIEPDMYEKMYNSAISADADIVMCNTVENESGRKGVKFIPNGIYGRKKIVDIILSKSLAYLSENGSRGVIRWCNWLRIYKRELIEKNNIQFDRRFRRSQDLQFTYETTLVAQNYYYLGNEYLLHNRVVGDSLSRGYTKNMWNLYVPLIERLYKDTEAFTELNLIPQMHLRAFFFVTDCIENEMKPDCPSDMATRIKLVEEIMNHPICEKYYGQIQIEKMNSLYQQYYKLIHEKNAKKIFSVTKKYKNKKKRKQRYINPVINFLTENKVTGAVYKNIRHKG